MRKAVGDLLLQASLTAIGFAIAKNACQPTSQIPHSEPSGEP